MKKLFILVGVLILSPSTISSQDLNLDQILENHYKATGMDELQNVKTIIMSGSLTTHVVMPYKVYRVRPNKYRMERDVNDITGLTVYDGQNGWFTAPWSKNPNPQLAPTPMLTDLIARSDFDGIIYNWKVKGHKAELVGVEKFNGSDTYKIKLTRNDGAIEYSLIDCKNFLLVKKISYQTVKDKELEVDNMYSDYKSVKGIMFAFTTENKIGDQPPSTIHYESIELGQPVDDKLFVMPTK